MRRVLSVALLVTGACLGDVEVPPDPPTVNSVESPTTISMQELSGSKEKGTSVLIDGTVVIEANDEESWSQIVTLSVGPNVFELSSARASGLASREKTTVEILYEPPCPQAPAVDRVEPYTQSRSVTVNGTRAAGTALYLDGSEIIPLGDEGAWTWTLTLPDADAIYTFTFVARDAKGRDSDPEVVEIELDRTAPGIASRYPPVDGTGIPTNALISVTFDDRLVFDGGDPPPETIVVTENGSAVAGFVSFSLLADTLEWFPTMGNLQPNSTYAVSVDPSLIVDAARNPGDASVGVWTYTYTTTAGPELEPPVPATLEMPPATTTEESVTLTGTKGTNTSVLVNGRKVVAVNPDTTWSYVFPLAIGTSSVGIATRNVADFEVLTPGAPSIERIAIRPDPPTIDSSVPTEVRMPSVGLTGGRPTDTSILLNDMPVVCRAPETTWGFNASLVPGVNDLRLTSRDAEGNVSEPVVFSVDYDQSYEGLVPTGFSLDVSFVLKDLSQVSGVREEFATGANNYGIDVWVEGPIEPGETCRFEDGERQDIKYVATVQHYIGTKAQHKVPFADEDYRGTDYLASMITGGVLRFRGLDATSDRRDGNGREVSGLLSGLTEEDLRMNIDCFGTPVVDACTRPTAKAGRYNVQSWTPRRREQSGLLEQGDYLLHILINLDRNGSWLSANDLETCWGDPAFDDVGMHRVVTRIALGPESYTLQIPQSEEHSGPDRDGSNRLFFITKDGVTIRWGPSNQ